MSEPAPVTSAPLLVDHAPADDLSAKDRAAERRAGFLDSIEARFLRASDELAAVASAELDVDEETLAAVVDDIRTASSWSAIRDVSMERATSLYGWLKSVVIAVGAGAALVHLSDGPLWLEASFAVFTLLAAIAPESEHEIPLLTGIVGAVASAIALLVQPVDGVNILQLIVATLVSCAVAFGLAVVVDSALRHLATSMSVDLAILLGLGVGLTFALRSLPPDGWSTWLGRGVTAGVVAGLGMGLLFNVTDVVSRLMSKVIDAFKMRRHAEAEFVQSCIWAMAGLTRAPSDPVDGVAGDVPGAPTSEFFLDDWQRRDVVAAAEYLTGVLEEHVTATLAHEDRVGHAFVAHEIARRAALLRSHKRAILLGRPDALDEFMETLRTAAVQGALRRWHELPTLSADEEADARPARRELAGKVLRRLAVLVIPLALAGYGWQTQEPGLLSSGALWVAVVLIDMLAPGTRKDVTDAASGLRSFLPHRT